MSTATSWQQQHQQQLLSDCAPSSAKTNQPKYHADESSTIEARLSIKIINHFKIYLKLILQLNLNECVNFYHN